ncbi:MAG: hypothetical protein H6716_20785 [Polyangiaceae bacterium]|nr:hypothetical protein [Polyangiaceae bacterium]
MSPASRASSWIAILKHAVVGVDQPSWSSLHTGKEMMTHWQMWCVTAPGAAFHTILGNARASSASLGPTGVMHHGGGMNQAASRGGGDNRNVKVIGITCGALFLLSCCCGSGVIALNTDGIVSAFVSGPQDTTDAFLDELRVGNYAQAYDRMDGYARPGRVPPYRATHDLAAFTAAVANLPALTRFTDRNVHRVEVREATTAQPARAKVSGRLTTPFGVQPIRLSCVKNGEEWYIDGLEVNGFWF